MFWPFMMQKSHSIVKSVIIKLLIVGIYQGISQVFMEDLEGTDVSSVTKNYDKKFVQKSDLKKHVKTVHEKKEPLICELCKVTFTIKTHY